MTLASQRNKNANKKADTKAAAEEKVEAPAVDESTMEAVEPAVVDEGSNAAAPPAKEPAPAPAVAQPKAVAAAGGGLQTPLTVIKDQIEPMPFGTLARIKGVQGALSHDDDGELGKEILIRPVSWNYTYVIAPNQNGAPADLCRYSDDNVHLNDGTGTTVEEWTAELQAMGYQKAGSKTYIDLIAILEDCENECGDLGNMVTLQLSPESVKMFQRLGMNMYATKKELGNIFVTAKTKSYDGKTTFTLMQFRPEH